MRQFRNTTNQFYEQHTKNDIQSIDEFMNEGESNEKGIVASQIDPGQLEIGTEIEYEHTTDTLVARKIALDHFAEPGGQYYYMLLPLMEKLLSLMDKMDEFNANNVIFEIENIIKNIETPNVVESVLDPLDGGLGKNNKNKSCSNKDITKISKTKSSKKEEDDDEDGEVEEDAGTSTTDVAAIPSRSTIKRREKDDS